MRQSEKDRVARTSQKDPESYDPEQSTDLGNISSPLPLLSSATLYLILYQLLLPLSPHPLPHPRLCELVASLYVSRVYKSGKVAVVLNGRQAGKKVGIIIMAEGRHTSQGDCW